MVEYVLADSGGLELLLLAAEATDRAASLRSAIDADGVCIRSALPGGTVREHPALRHELAAMAFTVRTLARLGLHLEPVKVPGRPPSSSSLSWRQS